jgi:hypothetical protein
MTKQYKSHRVLPGTEKVDFYAAAGAFHVRFRLSPGEHTKKVQWFGLEVEGKNSGFLVLIMNLPGTVKTAAAFSKAHGCTANTGFLQLVFPVHQPIRISR